MTSSRLGRDFADAVATKDHARVLELLTPDVDFRGMTPGRVWEAESSADVVDALGHWFEDSDVIEGVELVETADFADRERVG